tara:strand:- start:385 stop:963 length:579 start_codon:yes stop_codon:yes gene_type:complete
MNKLLSLLLAVPMFAFANITHETGVASDYVWRGVTQTQNGPSWYHTSSAWMDNGLYAGVFVGNVEFNDETDVEMDLFVGWYKQLGWLGVNLSYFKYDYMDNTLPSFEETRVGVDFWKVDMNWFKDMDTDAEYLEMGFNLWDGGTWGVDVMHMSDTMDMDMYGAKVEWMMSNKMKVNLTVYEDEQLVGLAYVW